MYLEIYINPHFSYYLIHIHTPVYPGLRTVTFLHCATNTLYKVTILLVPNLPFRRAIYLSYILEVTWGTLRYIEVTVHNVTTPYLFLHHRSSLFPHLIDKSEDVDFPSLFKFLYHCVHGYESTSSSATRAKRNKWFDLVVFTYLLEVNFYIDFI